jgi:calpain
LLFYGTLLRNFTISLFYQIDHSGKLGYEEFKTLWNDLRQWKKVFHAYDRFKTSSLDSFELRAALNSAGFRVSNSTFKCLAMRFSDQQGQVYFDDFILCAVRLKTMFDIFNTASASNGSKAQFTLDEFIQTTMYS